MSQYGSYGPRRSEIRKQKKQNTIVNGAIILVVIGIVFFAGTLIFGGNDSEPAAGDELEELNETEETQMEEEEENLLEEVEEESTNETEENTVTEEPAEATDSEEDTETNNEGNSSAVIGEGHWNPIGTVQEEPFVAVFERDHVNWGEMERAFMYASGLNEETMINWWTENGGDHLSAVGIISNWESRDTPYEIRLEWVTNEGWMPIYVKQLDHNPRR